MLKQNLFKFFQRNKKIINTRDLVERTFDLLWAKVVHVRIFFGSVLFHIWTEDGNLLCKLPYLVQLRENTTKKKL